MWKQNRWTEKEMYEKKITRIGGNIFGGIGPTEAFVFFFMEIVS